MLRTLTCLLRVLCCAVLCSPQRLVERYQQQHRYGRELERLELAREVVWGQREEWRLRDVSASLLPAILPSFQLALWEGAGAAGAGAGGGVGPAGAVAAERRECLPCPASNSHALPAV